MVMGTFRNQLLALVTSSRFFDVVRAWHAEISTQTQPTNGLWSLVILFLFLCLFLPLTSLVIFSEISV